MFAENPRDYRVVVKIDEFVSNVPYGTISTEELIAAVEVLKVADAFLASLLVDYIGNQLKKENPDFMYRFV